MLDLQRNRLRCSLLTLECTDFPGTSDWAGDEIAGLWQALVLSGARSALVPMWPTPVSSQEKLARMMQRSTLEGVAPAAAFRTAMLRLQSEAERVSEWAGSALIGGPWSL